MGKALPKELKQRMAQSVVGTGPSLIPVPHTPKPEKEEEHIPQIDELIDDRDDVQTLRSLVSSHVSANTNKKQWEKTVEGLSERIKGIIGRYGLGQGINKANCDGQTINYYPQSRSTINATKLLAAGVDQKTIDDCTDTTQTLALRIT
jgi:hypothetical protein